jgi:hypothetical protein
MFLHTARRTLFSALAILLLAAPAFAADPVFPVGSRVGLVPPPGFVPSTKFIGFENPQASAAILLVAMPAETYPDLEKSFTDEALKARGFKVEMREPVTLKDGKGIRVAGPKDADGLKRYESVMLASTSGITVIVSVQMIEASHAVVTDAMLRDAMKTVAVRKEIPNNEKLAVLPYKIGNLAGFHIVRSAHDGTAILTLGDKDTVEKVEQPFLLLTVVASEAPKPEERDKIARLAFSSAPGLKDIKIIRSEPLRIGQAAGHEIVAEAKDAASDIPVTAVQWLRFGQTAHLQMFAIGRRDDKWNDTFTKLRAIRDGIEPRQ